MFSTIPIFLTHRIASFEVLLCIKCISIWGYLPQLVDKMRQCAVFLMLEEDSDMEIITQKEVV
jgi:hypothetical protein